MSKYNTNKIDSNDTDLRVEENKNTKKKLDQYHSIRQDLQRMYQPIFGKGKNVFLYVVYALAKGSLPFFSAFIFSWIVKVIADILAKNQAPYTIGMTKPLILTAVCYGLIYLILYIVSVKIRNYFRGEFYLQRSGLINQQIEKYSTMDLKYVENSQFLDSLGNYKEATNNDSTGFGGVYAKTLELAADFVSLVIFIVLLAMIHPAIPLFGIFTLLVSGCMSRSYEKYYQSEIPSISRNDRQFGNINTISQDFSYGKDVRTYNMQETLGSVNDKLLNERFGERKKNTRLKMLYSLPEIIAFIGLDLITILVMVKLYEAGSLDLSQFVLAISVVQIFIGIINQIVSGMSFVSHEMVSIRNYYRFMDANLQDTGGLDLELSDFPNLDIEFEHVYFRYPGAKTWVLEDLNLSIKEGEKLALVGINGAGKTTLTNLVLGLYEADRGRVTIGGKDVKNLSRKTLNLLMTVK